MDIITQKKLSKEQEEIDSQKLDAFMKQNVATQATQELSLARKNAESAHGQRLKRTG